MFLSVFDVFKIGIGPSSSHTMGPMTAANRFLDELRTGDWPRPRNAVATALKASLHGSLAFTGIGHGTGRAVVLGLSGFAPDTVDPDRIDAKGMYFFRPVIRQYFFQGLLKAWRDFFMNRQPLCLYDRVPGECHLER